MKDNMNINRIEDYIVEGTNVSEILRNNKNKQTTKKTNKKDTLMGLGLAIIILIIFSIVCMLVSKYNEKEINNCINAGHTQTYCERGL